MQTLRTYVLTLSLVSIGLLGVDPRAVWAQKTEPRANDEAGLRKASKDYMSAIERDDRKAMAEFWTPAGIYVDDDGRSYKAREMIENAPESKDAPHGEAKLTTTAIRFLTPDVATEDGTSEYTPPGKSAPLKGQFSAVWVRQNGKWKLDSLREIRVTASGGTQHLSVLEPFVGDWTGQSGNMTMHVTAKWNPAKTYLRRDMSMTSAGKAVFSGTQQVGWDPIRQQIRSWVFDADGGYGEGSWSLEGTLWMVQTRGVHADGKTSQATHVFKFKDRDTVVWKSIDASVDGRPSKDFEMTLTRGDKPAAASAPAPAKVSSAKTSSVESTKKAALLASDAWKRVEHEYKEWASVQVVYTPQQMEENKTKLTAEINKMSAAELQQFIGELDGKLKTLLSKDAVEARAWLGQYLSVFTDGYRKKFIGDIPDFADMTSAQIQEEYLRLKAKALAQERAQASFDASRTQMVNQQLATDAAARNAANQAAAARSDGGNTNLYQSGYSPQPHGRLPPPQMQFTERVGNLFYALPGSSY